MLILRIVFSVLVVAMAPAQTKFVHPVQQESREDALFRHIAQLARDNELELDLVFRVIHVESRWKEDVVSYAGAVGLMQVMVPTGREILKDETISVESLKNPFVNVTAGIKYLAWLRVQFNGDMELVLLSYNRGIGRVKFDLAMGSDPDNGYGALIRRSL